MIERIPKPLTFIVGGVLIMQLAGCGTILYPERKGQKSGRIDAGVAILDGVGLLFFLIPGIIAYAVDFSNGTIYLPGTLSTRDPGNLRMVKFDPQHYTNADLEKIILKETGYKISFNQANLKVVALRSKEDMVVVFGKVLPQIQDAKIASLK